MVAKNEELTDDCFIIQGKMNEYEVYFIQEYQWKVLVWM